MWLCESTWRSALLTARVVVSVGLVGTCGCSWLGGSDCEPVCDGRVCGDDGCGGNCGNCVEGASCVDGLCFSDDGGGADCSQSCAELGHECGEHCGESCGSCPSAGQACVDHRCACEPNCDNLVCGDDDGCGGVCGGCPSDRNCQACALRLLLITDQVVGGAREVTLALDYEPSDSMFDPGMVDLRLAAVGGATLERVGLGEALMQGQKELFVHPLTGKPFQEIRDNVYRIMITSPYNNALLQRGRWLFLRFRVAGDDDTPGQQPIRFSLLREAAVFAPLAADETLADNSFAGSVMAEGSDAP